MFRSFRAQACGNLYCVKGFNEPFRALRLVVSLILLRLMVTKNLGFRVYGIDALGKPSATLNVLRLVVSPILLRLVVTNN